MYLAQQVFRKFLINDKMSFSSNSYPGFKLHDIGHWEWQWWGMRWYLTHDEVEQVIKEIEAEKNYMTSNFSNMNRIFTALREEISRNRNSEPIDFISEIATGFLGLVSNFSQTHELSYEYLKSKIQNADCGNGVIVDLSAKYSPQLDTALVVNSGKIYCR